MDIGMLLNLRDPIANRFEGASVSHVVHEKNALRSAKVGRRDGAEALLSCSVPDLKLDASAVNVDILDLEIDPNRGNESG